jgi:hypothetical protein
MTEGVFTEMMAEVEGGAFDRHGAGRTCRRSSPGWPPGPPPTSPAGCSRWRAARVGIATGFAHGPTVDKGARWEPEELTEVIDDLLAQAPARSPVYGTG